MHHQDILNLADYMENTFNIVVQFIDTISKLIVIVLFLAVSNVKGNLPFIASIFCDFYNSSCRLIPKVY